MASYFMSFEKTKVTFINIEIEWSYQRHYHQGRAARFPSVMTLCMVLTFQLRWFDWKRPSHFFINRVWIWSLFACLISLYNRGVSLVASFNLNVNESHLCLFKRHEVTGHRFCFVQALLVRDKLIFKVGWNWSLDIGRQERSSGCTKNTSKLQ